MSRCIVVTLLLTLIAGGCADRKPPFSREQFLAARSRCRATDAYVIASTPNTIGFHGTSDEHVSQAKCLKKELGGTNVETVVLGSQLHERP